MLTSKFPLLAIGIACLLPGCTTVPSLPEATGGIPVTEIVLRTKCELANAFWSKEMRPHWIPDNPTFAWLGTWTAQVDLTLQVLDSASFNPGATVTQPLRNGYGVVAGPSSLGGTSISSIPQNFAVAAGVNYNGQAMRTENLSFVFSVNELKRWRERSGFDDKCAVANTNDLSGRLGLQEWLQAALSPVASPGDGPNGLLYAGYHPKPLGAPAPPKSASGSIPKVKLTDFKAISNVTTAPKSCVLDLKSLEKRSNAALDKIDALDKVAGSATMTNAALDQTIAAAEAIDKNARAIRNSLKKHERPFGPVLDPAVAADDRRYVENLDQIVKLADAARQNEQHGKAATKPIADYEHDVANARDNAEAAVGSIRQAPFFPSGSSQYCAAVQSANASLTAAEAQISDISLDNAKAAEAKAEEDLRLANENLFNAKTALSAAANTISALPPIDPPIASIAQSVQFVVDMGANATPTWTFVRFKGPNSPLASVDSTRTHILYISLGPSALPDGSGGPGPAVLRSATNLYLSTLLPSRQ